MRKFLILMVVFFALFSGFAVADEAFDEGIDYELIEPAQPTDDPSRIEVVEIFWYGCPHCYHFEPTLETWKLG